MAWDDEQHWEVAWWGDCTNTFGEEAKQITYAHHMGLVNTPQGETWPSYDLEGKSVLDIGAGPVSMLLKTRNGGLLVALDPGAYPRWTNERYAAKDIKVSPIKGEDATDEAFHSTFDEVWIYNCLQHTDDPAVICANARKALAPGGSLRIFEWLNVPACPGHPHELKAGKLDSWLDGYGMDVQLNGDNGCWGPAYTGVFQYP